MRGAVLKYSSGLRTDRSVLYKSAAGSCTDCATSRGQRLGAASTTRSVGKSVGRGKSQKTMAKTTPTRPRPMPMRVGSDQLWNLRQALPNADMAPLTRHLIGSPEVGL